MLARRLFDVQWVPRTLAGSALQPQAADCVGSYLLPDGTVLRVALRDGALAGRLEGEGEVRFEKAPDGRLLMVGGNDVPVDLCAFVGMPDGGVSFWRGFQLHPRIDESSELPCSAHTLWPRSARHAATGPARASDRRLLMTRAVSRQTAPRPDQIAASLEDGRLGRLLRYVEEHLEEKITLERAARIACLKKCYFARVFRRRVGMTFGEWLRNVRIDRRP